MNEFKKLSPWPQILLASIIVELIVIAAYLLISPSDRWLPGWGSTGPGVVIGILGIPVSVVCLPLQIISGMVLLFRKKMIVFAVLGLMLVLINYYFLAFFYIVLNVGFHSVWISRMVLSIDLNRLLNSSVYLWLFLIISLVAIRSYFFFRKNI